MADDGLPPAETIRHGKRLLAKQRAARRRKEKKMSDDKTKVGSPDNKLISLTEDYEVRHWCECFDVEPDRLRAAVAAVGHSVDAVDTWLKSPLTQPVDEDGGLGDRADFAAGGEPPDG